MRLSVTGRHLVITDGARRQIGAKLRRLERLLDDSAVSAQCVVWQERQRFVCDVTVHARGDHRLTGRGRSARLPPAVTAAIAKVSMQARRVKDRWHTRRRAARAGGVA